MINARHTAYNLAFHSFQNSPETLLYDPQTLDAVIVVAAENSFYAAVVAPYQEPHEVAQALLRRDGTIPLLSHDQIQDLLNRGPVAISSAVLDYMASIPVAENNFDAKIYISTKSGTQGLSVKDTVEGDLTDSRIPDTIASLVAFA